MGQGQSSDKEVMPRCVVSDPAQPHNFSHRSEQKVKHDCFGCGKSDVPWEIRERPLYYYCTICDLEFHKNCLEYPTKVSSCRVCYKNVDIKYGQYSCNHEECFYVVHSKCATHGKIWDGEELEWEDEESEQAEDIAPYKKISGSLIEHCWHQHHFLKLEKYEGTRDSKKQCQACMRPVNPHDFYSCIECEFFIHEVCANLPRKLDHASHNHPLYMDPYPIYDRMHMNLGCSVCFRYSSGLKYRCKKDGCSEGGKQFQVDVNCILVPECFTHESHAEHRLFISTFGKDKRECQGCRWRHCQYLLQCVSCEFAICYTCATIPNELYHKYDDNPLSLCYGEKGVDGTYWCEVCEEELDPMEWFYTNTKQCTTIHRKCILGDNVYMKSGHTFEHSSDEVKVVCHGSSSRPICHTCHKYCPHPVYFKVYMPDGTEVDICSVNCHKI
ncbi:Cysteine/Histidine-rich C1 domain family protein [Arabidopsis thaliana]|uniref:Cysteine/Histidine-rich C1 domain family protein n=1 Tax=Arabidopsis thaliana TaxID=3702 RepID=F4J868_ARATH|nr:Cysteine/Histidine-rich C1 domain family protein [Arabidopsis thaliana]AEE79881.1 Cysteine/Histidine-rich C1 domain family protein [Arabidopsis thaliana]|eukprot:NP_191472.2 Cysteine/Histidine-rich C1 domain family protein [Arabidopsis thaliana]